MKNPLSTVCWHRILWIFLFVFTMQETPRAQDSLVAYSDTLSALEDTAEDSLWNSSTHQVFGPDFWEETDIEGLTDFTFQFFKYGGFLLVLLSIIIFLLPLIVIVLIIYLIYRQNRKIQWEKTDARPSPLTTPEDIETRNILRKQAAIRQGCWGVGLIVVEWIAGITIWCYVAGVILLCIAAANWLNAQLHKK